MEAATEEWFAPLERARKSGSRAFLPTVHVSLLFLTIYTKLVYFSYPSTLGDFGQFKDVLQILSVGYLSAY